MAGAGKGPTVVLIVVLVLALVACGVLLMFAQREGRRALVLEEALLKSATAAGVTDIDPAALKDVARVAQLAQDIEANFAKLSSEVTAAREAADAARREADDATARATAAARQVQEQTAKIEELTQAASAKDTELTTVRNDLQKLASEKAALEQKVAELEAALAKATQEQAAEEIEETAAEPSQPEEREPVEPSPPAQPEKTVLRELGKSEMFRAVQYVPKSQSLILHMADGQVLRYAGVPSETVEALLDAADFDQFYRFKIQGAFDCEPSDKDAVRAFWRNVRYRPTRATIQLLGP